MEGPQTRRSAWGGSISVRDHIAQALASGVTMGQVALAWLFLNGLTIIGLTQLVC
jgi:aryl-alcohol dehydrogenase-like predicted oxidoreductase